VLKLALGGCTTTIKPIKSKEQFPFNVKFSSREKSTLEWEGAGGGGAEQTKNFFPGCGMEILLSDVPRSSSSREIY